MSRHDTPFTESEIRSLLARKEGQFLEFKSLWNRREKPRTALKRPQVRNTIARVVAAFANADGGILLLGVDDEGVPSGHRYPDEAVEAFFQVPELRLRPSVSCRTGRIRVDGHEILIFEVSIAPEAVMVGGDGFPYRVGDTVVLEPQEVINARKEAYRRVGYEQRIRPGASLHDLDLELAERFISTGVFSDRTVEEALQRYGLIHKMGSGWRITNAALLLFGRAPIARWHPRSGVRFFRVSGTERMHGHRRNVRQLPRVEKALARAIEESHRLAVTQIRRSEKLHSLFFKEIPEYPEFAWQEAIVNAFAHPEAFTNEDYRELNGVNRDQAYREIQEMVRKGVITPAAAPGRGAVYRIAPDLEATLQFLESHLPTLREFFENRESLQNADYRRLFGVPRSTALRELQRLVELGCLRSSGQRRGTRYLPGSIMTGRKE